MELCGCVCIFHDADSCCALCILFRPGIPHVHRPLKPLHELKFLRYLISSTWMFRKFYTPAISSVAEMRTCLYFLRCKVFVLTLQAVPSGHSSRSSSSDGVALPMKQKSYKKNYQKHWYYTILVSCWFGAFDVGFSADGTLLPSRVLPVLLLKFKFSLMTKWGYICLDTSCLGY